MRMRFGDEITREIKTTERQRLSARAFHPQARSHGPITAPDRLTKHRDINFDQYLARIT